MAEDGDLPTQAVEVPTGAPRAEPAGRRIGPYRLLGVIGHGGMGAVYRAVREDAYEKVVALKLLRAGFESDEARVRFEAERGLLARLEHAGYETTSIGHYTQFQGASGFGGTSSATPLASGIVGLVLSVKPSLKVSQVRAILKRSTDKVGPEPYVGPGGGRNNRYGYGRINAFKAVTAASELIFENGFQ